MDQRINLNATAASWLLSFTNKKPGLMLLLAPDGQPLPKHLPKHFLSLRLSFPLWHLSEGFAAQVQVCGIENLQILLPDSCSKLSNSQSLKASEKISHKISQWRALSSIPVDIFQPDCSGKRIRKKQVFDWESGQFSRRQLLGLSPLEDLPLDFYEKEMDLSLQALSLLSSRGLYEPKNLASASVYGSAGIEHEESGNELDLCTIAKTLRIDTKTCTLCMVCQRVCPHGSLEFVFFGSHSPLNNQAPVSALLNHNRQICRGCNTCVDMCPPGALQSSSLSYWQQLEQPSVRLAHFDVSYCTNCNAPYPAGKDGESLCPGCKWRESHPYGTRLPTGFNT